MSRRTFMSGAAALGGAIVISGVPGAAWGQSRGAQRVYVMVLDGCRPEEISAELTPTLHALRAAGTWFPNARSTPIAETLPNHLAMMTGVLPVRGGVPANQVYDQAAGAERTVEDPADITTPTILRRLRDKGLKTGSVLSKDYLYSLFNGQATFQWEPKPLMPVTNHALDGFTMAALKRMVLWSDPHLVFANFGNIDRFGHADFTGTSVRALRYRALTEADKLMAEFVAFLKLRGTWKSSTIIVLADHSMDWSVPSHLISLTKAFASEPLLAGNIGIADNGGADLLAYTGPESQRAAALDRARQVALNTPGVLSVHTTDELNLGSKAGDLVVYCKAGWRFSDPLLVSNPIPGNHGHPATHPIPFFLTGGAVRQAARSRRVSTMDVAPTVSTLLGLEAPEGGYDGKSVL